jgi:hypothetical protein
MNTLVRAFSRNRAEEMGADLWGDFVVPPYFDRLPVMYVRKPYVIVGGRGCGKTTLLRYWSYHSQFSSRRHTIPDDTFKTIGLYIRTDIQFLSSFTGSGIDDAKWGKAFEHALCLAVADELIGCLEQINCDTKKSDQYGGLSELDFSPLNAFDAALPSTFTDFKKFIRRNRFQLSSWINNLDSAIQAPIFYPLKPFIEALIATIRDLHYLKESVFAVFIDEYESFLKYQHIFVNSLMKLSQPPLVFHVAMKRNGMPYKNTSGNEMIQEPDDYRTIDIEKEQGDDFQMFAAELFFFRLMLQNISPEDHPVDMALLTDPTRIGKRRDNKAYVVALNAAMDKVLPSVSPKEVAIEVLNEPSLKKRLLEAVAAGLTRTNPGKLEPTDFIDEAYPEASVVAGALLHQRKKAADIFAELKKHRSGKPSQFDEWIHHFLFGTLLYLYSPLNRICPLYSGFSAFISLAQGNARHFLELCHLAISQSAGKRNDATGTASISVSISDQAKAARECSARFLEDIKGSGNYGTQLYQVATTLGQIFKLSQQRPAQSEPEKNHFAVNDGRPSDGAISILNEAEKWGVLIGREENKVKSSKYESRQYYLNPIFSPSYGTSYRSGRKLDLDRGILDNILLGDHSSSSRVIREFERSWRINVGDQLSLIQDEE